MYGRAAFEVDPARYYDMATYWAAMAPITGPGFPGQRWSYPPSVMLAAEPFGTLPYFAALALWTALGLAVFTAALRLWTKDMRVLAPILLAPAAIFGLISGQFAFVAAAIMLAVLRWRGSRPLLAGLLLGLLTLKPQLGLFFPVLLLAAGNWRTILAAAATALALAGATGLIWGMEVWTAYLQTGIANQSLVLSDPERLGGPFMPTIFMNLRVAGLPFAAAMAVQAVAALAAIALIWATFRRRPAPGDLRANAVFLAAAAFGTPYMLSYDTLALAAVMLLLAAQGRGRLLPLLAFVLPLLQLAAGSAGLPGPALVPVLIAVHLFRRRDF
jgi:arabinofuranan 3-O-arabinosyltransferase